MQKKSYEVEVLIHGKPAKEYSHDGKIYIEGREGTPFSLKFKNNSYGRKLFVPTVDGLSILNGEKGDFNSHGYIVEGYGSVTIEGWRTSDKDVAEFYFSSPDKAYSKRIGKGDNIGVIGVAVFEEKDIPVYHCPSGWTPQSFPYYPEGVRHYEAGDSTFRASSGPSYKTFMAQAGDTSTPNLEAQNCCYMASAGMNQVPEQALGTGWGESRRSEVTSVSFERKSAPDAIFEIYYNTRKELEKIGIDFKKAPLYVTPQAFPGQYCKPPID